MRTWNYMYDAWFAHVYDQEFNDRVDLRLREETATVGINLGGAEETTLNLKGVTALRKLLQAAERRLKELEQ